MKSGWIGRGCAHGLVALFALLACSCLQVAVIQEPPPEILVPSIDRLPEAVAAAQPGETLVLADGDHAAACTLDVTGLPGKPITIRSRTVGGAVLQGPVLLRGRHLSFSGFDFENQGCLKIRGTGIRVNRCRWSDSQAGVWIHVGDESRNVEIAYCSFEHKTVNRRLEDRCQLMVIMVLNRNEGHRVHHNHFLDVPKGGLNGFETIQLIDRRIAAGPVEGTSGSIIESNLFERCNGEGEIISVKSNGSVIRGNTFRACRGTLSLRKGHGNTVSGNFFFGDGESGTGGVRLQGHDQVVANNYFHDLEWFGISMMDGTPGGLYARVERARVLFNTFIDCRPAIQVGVNHSKHPNGTVPKDCEIADNLFFLDPDNVTQEQREAQIVKLVRDDEPENWTWSGNVARGRLGVPESPGLKQRSLQLRYLENQLALPGVPIRAAGKSAAAPWTRQDAVGSERGDAPSVGALESSAAGGGKGPLTADRVGQQASRDTN